MDTKSFNNKNFDKSRAVCEGIEREDGGGRVVLTERERQILDMWPKFEDGEHVWFGDAVEACHNGAIIVEAIEFSRGKVQVKDAEDGDWNTSMCAIRPLKRPAPVVLDADGVEICKGEILRGIGRSQHLFEVLDPHHVDPELGSKFSVRCRDLDEGGEECHCIPRMLTHTRPDSWERLEEDAEFNDETGIVGGNLDIVRRAKALAGVEE